MEDEKTTSVVKIEELNLDEERLAEQLYNNAGLDPVVLFLEETRGQEIILQVDEVAVTQTDVDEAHMILKKGLEFQLTR